MEKCFQTLSTVLQQRFRYQKQSFENLLTIRDFYPHMKEIQISSITLIKKSFAELFTIFMRKILCRLVQKFKNAYRREILEKYCNK